MRRMPNPPYFFALAVLLQLVLHRLLPGVRWASLPWSLVGLLPIVAGGLLNLVADRQVKAKGTTVKPFLPSVVLVTDGVFAWSRNPMYLGLVLVLVGVASCLGSATPLLVAFAFAWWIDARFIRPEERHLAEQFGEVYEAYARRVGRWV
jgi:protein-S-isoprenylcysteine O-methyltransferase Ste14